ncbi:MAG TPA: hypothetical protein VFX79_02280 [Candidatus Saccharimonadales bacterium]|nr:hypothetical protein [Candidatus Saccharimonadales bacterium]
MADLGPGEVMERFRGDLQQATQRVERSEAAKSEAEKAAADASGAATAASSGVTEAKGAQHKTERVVISALESLGVDPGDKELCAALMEVRGKSETEIQDYFAHLQRLGESGQPFVVIEGIGKTISQNLIIYGRTAGTEDDHSLLKRGDSLGDRRLTIPASQTIGFGTLELELHGRSKAEMFMSKDSDGIGSSEEVIVNPNQIFRPFEEIHFVESGEDIERLTGEVAGSDDIEAADNIALKELGLPAMVAYGQDAVQAVTRKLASRGEKHDIFSMAAYERLGLPTIDGRSLSDLEISDETRENLQYQFHLAIADFLENRDRPLNRSEREGGVTFMSALQDKIGFNESEVIESIKMVIDRGITTRRADKKYTARTKEGPRPTKAMTIAATDLAELGVSVSPDSAELQKAGYDLETKALRDYLKGYTLPLIDPISRRRLRREIRELSLVSLALGTVKQKS